MRYLTPLFCGILSCSIAACSNGSGSGNGSCADNLLVGDLVITEVMANPEGDDSGNEYFEIYNASSDTIELTGLFLVSDTVDMTSEKNPRSRHRQPRCW